MFFGYHVYIIPLFIHIWMLIAIVYLLIYRQVMEGFKERDRKRKNTSLVDVIDKAKVWNNRFVVTYAHCILCIFHFMYIIMYIYRTCCLHFDFF